MKKVIALLLVFFLIIPISGCAVADKKKQQKQELLLYGVPLGATYKEALETWKEKGVDIAEIGIKDIDENDASFRISYPNENRYYFGKEPTVKFEGYDVSFDALFKFQSEDNKSLDDSVLYYGSYFYYERFNTLNDLENAYKEYTLDLLDKLINRYGTGHEYGNKYGYNPPNTTEATWKEGNFLNPNSQLHMLITKHTEDLNSLSISFVVSMKDIELSR